MLIFIGSGVLLFLARSTSSRFPAPVRISWESGSASFFLLNGEWAEALLKGVDGVSRFGRAENFFYRVDSNWSKVQLNINSKALVAHIDRVVWRQPSDDLSYLATVKLVYRSQKYFWSPSSTSTWRLMKWRHHDVIDVEVHSWSWRWTPKKKIETGKWISEKVLWYMTTWSSLYDTVLLRYGGLGANTRF